MEKVILRKTTGIVVGVLTGDSRTKIREEIGPKRRAKIYRDYKRFSKRRKGNRKVKNKSRLHSRLGVWEGGFGRM